MALTREEREQFLAEPHIGALSVDAGPDRAPLTVPIWYLYTPGGGLTVLTGRDSRKYQCIKRAGRFSMMVERVEPTVRYVSVEGPVTEVVEGSADDHRRFANHYLPPDKAERYLAFAAQELDEDLVLVTMSPQRWVSADLGEL